jgi:hypothetical protein
MHPSASPSAPCRFSTQRRVWHVQPSVYSFQDTDFGCRIKPRITFPSAKKRRLMVANSALPLAIPFARIVSLVREALDTQFGPAHTGIVYTPPSFSDHIGVSLLLDDVMLPRDLVLNESDAATRKAQPHKLQKSIVSFFSNAAASSDGAKPKAKPKVKALPNVSKNRDKASIIFQLQRPDATFFQYRHFQAPQAGTKGSSSKKVDQHYSSPLSPW